MRKTGFRAFLLTAAVLLAAALLYGCSEDRDDETYTCKDCGLEMTATVSEVNGVGAGIFHGENVCNRPAPCGIEGHKVVKAYCDEFSPCGADGVAHIPCPVCNELLCGHGEPCVTGDEFYQLAVVVFSDGQWADLLATPDVTHTGTGDCTIYIIPRNGCHSPVYRGSLGGDGLYVNAATFESGKTSFSVSLFYSTSGFSYESGHGRSERFEIEERSFSITIEPPPPQVGSTAGVGAVDAPTPTPSAAPTPTPSAAPIGAEVFSGDTSLKVFKLTFPDGAAIDMRDREARRNISVSSATSARVTAKARSDKATVTGDVGDVTLAEGLNEFRVKVTAENGDVSYFNFAVTVAPPSSDASLKSLVVSGYAPGSGAGGEIALHPSFDPATLSYILYSNAVADCERISVECVANHANATVLGNPAVIRRTESGDAWTKTRFTLTVTAEDGVTAKNYTVEIREVVAVLYYANLVDSDDYGSQVKVVGIDLTLLGADAFTNTGFVLTSWNTSPDGTGTNYALGAAYSADVPLTLYAQWEAEGEPAPQPLT